jgi:hypothetical protein
VKAAPLSAGYGADRSNPHPNTVRITHGEHAGRVGVVVGRDPKWTCVRLTDGSWPFPVDVWVHRREFVAVDRLEGVEEALV